MVQVLAVVMLFAFAGVTIHHLWRTADDHGGARPCTTEALASGFVEVSGEVEARASQLVRAPISGRRAVGYWLRIEQERGPMAWETVVEIHVLAPFELCDAHGRVSVDAPAEAVHADIFELRGSGGPFAPLPGRVERLLHEHQRATQGVLFGKAFRWREQVLEPGHDVTLRGWARRVPAPHATASVPTAGQRLERPPAGPYRASASRWVLMGSASRPLQVIDRGEAARRPFKLRRLVRA